MIIDKTDIRRATTDDRLAIRILTERAFDRQAEADLVEALLDSDTETSSFVAQIDQQIVGHVLFSQVTGPHKCMALGPLSVDPAWRDFLIGTAISRHAIRLLQDEGWQSLCVLGDPVYYGRFGFKNEPVAHIQCQYQGPQFMGLELTQRALTNYDGRLDYPAPFAALAP